MELSSEELAAAAKSAMVAALKATVSAQDAAERHTQLKQAANRKGATQIEVVAEARSGVRARDMEHAAHKAIDAATRAAARARASAQQQVKEQQGMKALAALTSPDKNGSIQVQEAQEASRQRTQEAHKGMAGNSQHW